MTAWFKLKTPEMGAEVRGLIESYKKDQAGRRARYVRNLELYERRPLLGYSAHGYYVDDARMNQAYDLDRLGLIRSAVSTAVANIYAPQKPKPQFQTLGATWATRRKAYRLDRICEGIINQRQGRWINVWSFMIDAGVEAALQGCAAVYVTADRLNKKVSHELIPLPDLFTDASEGRTPKNLFMRRPINEDDAIALYPKLKNAIKGAPPYEWFGRAATRKPRSVRVIEIQYAWRLPLSKEEPGRWCCVINGEVAEEGEWTAPAFPFVFLLWEPNRDGFWASGIGDEGGEMAQRVGELDKRLFYREIIASGKRIYYRPESVKPDDLALNEASVAIPVEAGAEYPHEEVSTPFSPMELDFLNQEKTDYWDAIGISQVSAAARREQGVNSGVAIMTLNDTKAGRQLVKSQRYEQAFVDLAHQYVWRLRELADEEPDFTVSWPGKSILRQVKWSDADVEDDMFSVSVAPASSLPHDPAGRQEMVQDLYQAGMISQETAKSLIGWPDLESELNVENSEYEYIDSLIEKYLDADPETWSAGDYEAPEGFIMNKAQAVRRFASAWFRARIDQQTLPKEERAKAEFNLSLLTRYIKELDALMQPPPAPAAPAPGAAPTPDQLPANQTAQAPAPMAA